MASKPASLPRWANVGGSIVVPISAKLDVGFVADEEPPAQYLNFLHNLVFQWLDYLNDGDLEGAHTIDNTLGVTGLITATAGLTAAVNQDVTVSGSGEFKHGELVSSLPPAAGILAVGSSWQMLKNDGAVAAQWLVPSGANDAVLFPIVLKHGDRIKSIDVFVRDTAAANAISCDLWKSTPTTGANAKAGSTDTSAGDGTRQTLNIGSLTETLATDTIYQLIVRADTATGTTHAIYGIEVTYDRP